jgi:hypothetical protein
LTTPHLALKKAFGIGTGMKISSNETHHPFASLSFAEVASRCKKVQKCNFWPKPKMLKIQVAFFRPLREYHPSS